MEKIAQKADLYSILTSYAAKNNSPYIEINSFVNFLEWSALKNADENPQWQKWKEGAKTKLDSELSALAEEGKCELLYDTPDGRIYMPYYCKDLLRQYYKTIDDKSEMPFPSEESLGMIIPESQLTSLGSGSQFISLIENLEKSREREIRESSIIRINFPDEAGSALMLSEIMPKKLIESCLLKFSSYIRQYGNKEYTLGKLLSQLPGSEPTLKDFLNKIQLRPLDCYNSLTEGGDFSYIFWAHFCILIKSDIKKKKDRLSGDLSVLQGVYIIESLNGYYKSRAVKAKEKEAAFKRLEFNLGKPNYIYTMDQIVKFTNSKGMPLLGQYTREELAEYLKKKATESAANMLPDLLILTAPGNVKYFIQKNRMLLLCARLLFEAKDKIKKAITKEWLYIIKNYESEPAMENDKEFENTLGRSIEKLCPDLSVLLNDPKLLLVYDELGQAQDMPGGAGIFEKGTLVPYSSMLAIKRKDILYDVHLHLPLWYSMSAVVAIIKFFKRF